MHSPIVLAEWVAKVGQIEVSRQSPLEMGDSVVESLSVRKVPSPSEMLFIDSEVLPNFVVWSSVVSIAGICQPTVPM